MAYTMHYNAPTTYAGEHVEIDVTPVSLNDFAIDELVSGPTKDGGRKVVLVNHASGFKLAYPDKLIYGVSPIPNIYRGYDMKEIPSQLRCPTPKGRHIKYGRSQVWTWADDSNPEYPTYAFPVNVAFTMDVPLNDVISETDLVALAQALYAQIYALGEAHFVELVLGTVDPRQIVVEG